MKIKKLLFSFCCFLFAANAINAQTPILWGLTSGGGANNLGTAIQINGDGTGFSTPHQFGQLLYPGANPAGSLIRAANGKYYGLTSTGGKNNDGVLFSFDTATATYTDLYDFDGPHGATPLGSLIQASNGILYGTGSVGGSHRDGVVFSFDPTTNTYTDLFDFNGTTGSNPQGSLMQATNGQLYGMASSGGSNSAGVIFSFNDTTFAYNDIHDFDILNGSNPYGDLIQASNGKLYGMTFNGGAGSGVIFSYDYSSPTYAVTQVLNPNSGFTPNGNLLNINGVLYGITAGGGYGYGVIYKYNPASGTYSALHNFNQTDGFEVQYPNSPVENFLNTPSQQYNEGAGSLILATDGKLYGVTDRGGANDGGVIFSIDTATFTYTKLYDFNNGVSGSWPLGSLFQASDGKLYGMTSLGDLGDGYNNGTIFSYDITGGGFSSLYEFDDGDYSTGYNPIGSFIEPTPGKLYSMTSLGGNNSYGVIFSYDITGGGYNKEFAFNNNYTAGVPLGSLVQAGSLLYGTTSIGDGGSGNSLGDVFAFDMTKGTGDNGFNPLVDFDGTTNGSTAEGSLYYSSSDGLLYGTTYTGDGGSGNNDGTIFSFDPNSTTLTNVYDFNRTTGANTVTSLLEIVPGGDLYGTAPTGGSNKTGVIFGFNRGSSTIDTLYNFDGNSGAAHPNGSLVQAANGILYGVTSRGGASANGVLISYNPTGSVYTELHSFDGTNGALPMGNLVQDADGKLYGLSSAGGVNNAGTLFNYDINSTTFTNLLGLSIALGSGPTGALLMSGGNRFYALTYNGGGSNAGVLFSYDISQASYDEWLDFNGTNGASPNGSLIKASNGLLYGMTSGGGLNNDGVIFSIDPVSLAYSELLTFNGFNGANPQGSLFQASDGLLYGMASNGGAHGRGVLFRFNTTTLTYTDLVDFDGSTNGNVGPYGNSLMQANDGKLYGTTNYGITGYGNIFSYDPTNSTFTNEFNFINEPSVGLHVHGGYPTATLIQLSDGLLYGIVLGGGSVGNGEAGAIFSYNIATHKDTLLHSFDTENAGGGGGDCYSAMLLARNGLLYGLNRIGYSTVRGTLFSMDPTNTTIPNPTYTVPVSFDGSDNGATPYGGLIQASDSKLYGMTNQGGANNDGVIFNYDYTGSGTYTKIRDLAPGDGINPKFTSLLEVEPSIATAVQHSPDNEEIFSLYPNPNNGEFTVNLSRLSNEEDAVRIEVINMIGETIVTRLTTISGGHMDEMINLPNSTAEGTYLVRLTAGKNVYTTKVNVSRIN